MNSELAFHVETRIAEILLSDNSLHKVGTDGTVSSLTDKVKDYVMHHIDKDDVVGSLVNILAPGVLSMAIGGWFGILLGLALRVFNVDIYSIFTSIWSSLKPSLSGDQKVSSQQVDQIVHGAVREHAGASATASWQDIRMLKLAMIEYDAHVRNIKQARRSTLDDFSRLLGGSRYGRGAAFVDLLGKVLSWVFKVALASAGLMVAGDVVNKILHRPSALDDTIQKGKPTDPEISAPPCASTQTKFKVNPSYHEENYNTKESDWTERAPNTQSGIVNMLINFAKEVYQGLDTLDSQIKTSSTFQTLVNEIAWYNHASAGDPIVFLPTNFKSKKMVVDCFIDEVAKKTP